MDERIEYIEPKKEIKANKRTEKRPQLPRHVRHRHPMLPSLVLVIKGGEIRQRIVLLARMRERAAAPGDAVEGGGGRTVEGDGVEPVAVGFVAEDIEGGCWASLSKDTLGARVNRKRERREGAETGGGGDTFMGVK